MLWVDITRCVLVRQWQDGSMEVSTRGEPDAIWGPPVKVVPENTRDRDGVTQ